MLVRDLMIPETRLKYLHDNIYIRVHVIRQDDYGTQMLGQDGRVMEYKRRLDGPGIPGKLQE